MKNQIEDRLNRVAVLLLLVIIVVGCDTFQEDVIQNDKLVDFGQTHFYLLPGTSTVIDIKSIVENTFTNGTITISKKPAHGVLSEVNPLILIYQPNFTFSAFAAGTDQFEISIIENGNTIVRQLISITMVTNRDDPCYFFAVQDVETVIDDSPIAIKYMENDWLCGVELASVQATIYLAPKHGQAELQDDLIIYTPDPGSTHFDTIIYKITVGNPSILNSSTSTFGLITLSRSSCVSYFPGSVVLDLTDPGGDITAVGDCGEGLLIHQFSEDWRSCWEAAEFSVELVSQSGRSGKVCYQPGGQFVFIRDPQFGPSNEIAKFQICSGDQCGEFVIHIQQLKDTWTVVSRVSNLEFNEEQAKSVFFANERVGFVGSGSIWKTIDGGVSWRMVLPWNTFGVLQINDIYFIDDTNGFAAYQNTFDGGLLKTVDGGETWTLVEGPPENTVSVYFFSTEVGFIGTTSANPLGYQFGRIYITTDGGAHWAITRNGWFGVLDIQFLDATVGFAYAGYHLLRTNDGGSTWQPTSLLPISGDPNEAISSLANNGTKLFFNFTNALWTSTDGIKATIKRHDDTDSYHNAISFSPSGQLGIAVGSRYGPRAEVLVSIDSGETWSTTNMEPSQFGPLILIDVSIPTDNVAFALASNGHILKLSRE
jgi:photosystem II stability/assembly factor-like uncharacterized protein